MSNNLIAAGKESELLKQQELKATSEMNNLMKELSDCKAEKEDLRGKLKMALTELDSAIASIKWMNTGSKKLDEILGSQKTDKSKFGIGYTHGTSSSKDKGKSVSVQGPIVYSMILIVHPPLKSVNARMCISQNSPPHVIFVELKDTLDHTAIKEEIISEIKRGRNLLLLNRSRLKLFGFIKLT